MLTIYCYVSTDHHSIDHYIMLFFNTMRPYFSRIIAVSGVIFVLGAFLVLLFRDQSSQYFSLLFGAKYDSIANIEMIAVGLLFSGCIYLATYYYGESRIRAVKTSAEQPTAVAKLERHRSSDVEFLRREYREQIASQVREYLGNYTETELRPQLESMLDARLDTELSKGVISKIDQRLKERISKAASKDNLITFAAEMLVTAKSKILEKAEKSERASTTFRSLGIGLMVFGLAVAVSRVFGYLTPLVSWPPELVNRFAEGHPFWFIVINGAPTMGLVLFIEFLALLFFRLYIRAEQQLRYFSNEAVNLEMKFTSLAAAIHCGDSKDLSKVIANLATTERNFVLEKNQQTIEFMNNEGSKDDLRDAAAIFTAAVDKVKSSATKSTSSRSKSAPTGET